MKIDFLKETESFIQNLELSDETRVYRVRSLVQELGFSAGIKYIKKISKKDIWELRAGKVRLFLYIKNDYAVCVHAIYKKSQKLKNKDIVLAEKRSRYLI